MSESPPNPKLPRWVKVQGAVLIVYLSVIAAMIAGVIAPSQFGLRDAGHGPTRSGHR